MKPKDPYRVPKKMRARYDAIIAITDEFCREHLNEEYADLARQMTAALARKRPSPLQTGRPLSWAAGVIYALGQVNFLFDKSQTPHMRATELCKAIGVSQNTASARAKRIRDLLGISILDLRWTLPGKMDSNPMAWYIMVNGLPVDARRMPREIQEIAYQKGLIPYIPGERQEE